MPEEEAREAPGADGGCMGLLRRAAEYVEEKFREEGGESPPLYWSDSEGFLFYYPTGAGTGLIIKGFCEKGVPRVLARYHGVIQLFHIAGKERLIEFLSKVLEIGSRYKLQMALDEGNLYAEVMVPHLALYTGRGDESDMSPEEAVFADILVFLAIAAWIGKALESLEKEKPIPSFVLDEVASWGKKKRENPFFPI